MSATTIKRIMGWGFHTKKKMKQKENKHDQRGPAGGPLPLGQCQSRAIDRRRELELEGLLREGVPQVPGRPCLESPFPDFSGNMKKKEEKTRKEILATQSSLSELRKRSYPLCDRSFELGTQRWLLLLQFGLRKVVKQVQNPLLIVGCNIFIKTLLQPKTERVEHPIDHRQKRRCQRKRRSRIDRENNEGT